MSLLKFHLINKWYLNYWGNISRVCSDKTRINNTVIDRLEILILPIIMYVHQACFENYEILYFVFLQKIKKYFMPYYASTNNHFFNLYSSVICWSCAMHHLLKIFIGWGMRQILMEKQSVCYLDWKCIQTFANLRKINALWMNPLSQGKWFKYNDVNLCTE